MSLRNRIIIIVYILSVVASVFIFSFCMKNVTATIGYTAYSDAATNSDRVYLAQNVAGCGRIFALTDGGDVKAMFASTEVGEERVEQVACAGDNVYAVLSTIQSADESNEENADNATVFYRIICLNRDLKLQSQTELFTIDDELLSDLNVIDKGMYLSMIAPDGSFAEVFGISIGELKAPDLLDGTPMVIDSIRKRNSTKDRFFAQASYVGNELSVRTDADFPVGAFAYDQRVADAVGRMRLSPGQLFKLYAVYFIIYIAALLIWLIILFLIVKMLVNRNRMFYYVVVAETVLAVITGVGVYTVVARSASAQTIEHSRFAVISLLSLADRAGITDYVDYSSKGFYDSNTYQGIRHSLTEFVRQDGNSEIFYDVAVVRLRDEVTVASASGRNLENITHIFGEELDSVSTSLYRGNKYDYEDITIDNQRMRAIAVADDDTIPDYAIIGVIHTAGEMFGILKENLVSIIVFALIFAIGSLLIVGIWYLLNRDLILLESALADTAMGRELPARPVTIGRDTKDMWDSLSEINKRVEEIQYSKLRILEAYYRFAPKNIEKFLQRDSIIDVVNGDHANLNGTICTLNAGGHGARSLQGYDKVIGFFGEYQKSHGCMIIGKSPDMNIIQLFMQESEKNVCEFLTEALVTHNQSDYESGLSASLFYDRCHFGVAGTDEETTTYLDADRKRIASLITAIVSELHLSLVISEDIKERENVTGPLRFIGYVGCGTSGGAVRLYEVLDACPARIRAQKIALLDRFNEALNAFYEKDFYISRNMFSDILKEMPHDALVKWYVFESDRYLNENADDTTFKNLHV